MVSLAVKGKIGKTSKSLEILQKRLSVKLSFALYGFINS